MLRSSHLSMLEAGVEGIELGSEIFMHIDTVLTTDPKRKQQRRKIAKRTQNDQKRPKQTQKQVETTQNKPNRPGFMPSLENRSNEQNSCQKQVTYAHVTQGYIEAEVNDGVKLTSAKLEGL